MKILIVIGLLSLLPAFTGIWAARLWYESSKIEVIPAYARYGNIEPVGDISQTALNWLDGALRAGSEAAELNKRAARWTAIAVALGAITTVIGAALPLLMYQ
ncbi:hypothetical protein HHL24_12575 [Paraburkholderia sp. RP-4-7]|uniref:Uncharacterized protein n=1 Tax=Paraburkholderia polaris TaxID=2728848 RepID=A0A848IBK0_9BURK|nr:hypothetical protein [Paraburkholderia polaris]